MLQRIAHTPLGTGPPDFVPTAVAWGSPTFAGTLLNPRSVGASPMIDAPSTGISNKLKETLISPFLPICFVKAIQT
jgi:hypothetical protein